MSLTSHENALLSSCTFEVDVAEEANVVLIVPCNWQPQWSAESGVTNNTGSSGFLGAGDIASHPARVNLV